MRAIPLFLFSLCIMLALPAQADDLQARLDQFFKTRDPQHAAGMQVVVRTPQTQWPTCEAPQFTLPGNSRLWGNISVAASCGENRRFLQVQVQVTGQYLVAVRQISRGSTLSASDFSLKTGRLDTLPARSLFSPEGVSDAVALRDLLPDQPVLLSMLRQPWRVKAGENVIVIASGDGFNASGEGKALNNATSAQWVRVRMGNGQIVSGRVGDDGNILITL